MYFLNSFKDVARGEMGHFQALASVSSTGTKGAHQRTSEARRQAAACAGSALRQRTQTRSARTKKIGRRPTRARDDRIRRGGARRAGRKIRSHVFQHQSTGCRFRDETYQDTYSICGASDHFRPTTSGGKCHTDKTKRRNRGPAILFFAKK